MPFKLRKPGFNRINIPENENEELLRSIGGLHGIGSSGMEPDTTMDEMTYDPGSVVRPVSRRVLSPAAQALQKHITSMPQREDYKPSILRKILASGAGFSGGWFGGPEQGFQTATGIADQPFRNAMQSWSMKTAPLEKQEQLETGQANVEYRNRMADAANTRANAAEDRASKDVWRPVTSPLVMNQGTGETRETGLPHELSFEEKQTILNKHRDEANALKAKQAKELHDSGIAAADARAARAEAGRTARYQPRKEPVVTPLQESQMYSETLRQMFGDPNYKDAIKKSGANAQGVGGQWILDPGSPNYARAKVELDKRIKEKRAALTSKGQIEIEEVP